MYREILTKAIIAKGEKKTQETMEINVGESVSKVLGCWIINHQHHVTVKEQQIFIEGSYEIYLWFGFNNNCNCGLHKELFTFSYEIPYTFTQESSLLNEQTEIKDYVKENPTCSAMSYDTQNIKITVESQYLIDIIGETKLKIKVDDVVIDQMINTNYVKEKK